MNIFFQILVIAASLYIHPLHVTLTNIEYLQDKNKYEVTFKIFSDDFEAAITNLTGVKTNMGKENEIKDIETYMIKYINERFSIIFDNKKVDFEYISKRNNYEATWITIMFESKKGSVMKIQNELLTDIYDDQKNLIIFKSDNLQKGFDMDASNNSIEIRLNEE